ncbi:MAG: APC family permease, partial [Micrococcales bacterium]|nr:APC family permease [Micrococcales bacterium]
EILVSLAVIVFFMKNKGENFLKVVVAPVLAIIGLVIGEYLLMSRFNLLGSLASDDVTDPTAADAIWKLSPLGWILVLLPFIALAVGFIWGLINKKDEAELSADILS